MSDFEGGGSPQSILENHLFFLGPTFYIDGASTKFVPVPNWLLYTPGAKSVPVPNWYRCQIYSFYTLGAKLVLVPNWLFYTLGAKLTLLHSWCQIGSGAKLTLLNSWCQIGPVPNWLRCQIDAGAKLSSNPPGRCPCKKILSGVKSSKLNGKKMHISIFLSGIFSYFWVFLIVLWCKMWYSKILHV